MKKHGLLFLLVVAALTLGSLALWARPGSIKCPIDGEYMFFDRQVGYGHDAVCWYSHMATVQNPGGQGVSRVKHEAYVPCGD
jgi:hypothetical protein